MPQNGHFSEEWRFFFFLNITRIRWTRHATSKLRLYLDYITYDTSSRWSQFKYYLIGAQHPQIRIACTCGQRLRTAKQLFSDPPRSRINTEYDSIFRAYQLWLAYQVRSSWLSLCFGLWANGPLEERDIRNGVRWRLLIGEAEGFVVEMLNLGCGGYRISTNTDSLWTSFLQALTSEN